MTVQRYFYHLKFELYDSPTPATKHHPKRQSSKEPTKVADRSIFLPPAGSDIFRTIFPEHARPVSEYEPRPNIILQRDYSNSVLNSPSEAITNHRPSIIDCGPSRAENTYNHKSDPSKTSYLGGEQTVRQTNTGRYTAELAVRDWRFGPVRVERIDMGPYREQSSSTPSLGGLSAAARKGTTRGVSSTRSGINAGPRSQATQARFEPLGNESVARTGAKNTELGWGIVHLYRDDEESQNLERLDNSQVTVGFAGSTSSARQDGKHVTDNEDVSQECETNTTVLCIPAVPSYMTPSDFLGWVGEKTREEVSHFRMVMTGKMNRYLVLLKFRDAAVARKWKQDFDGKVFGGMEPENCHVMFIKSIVFQTPLAQDSPSFPDTSHDPFTPSLGVAPDSSIGTSLALKPFPPPTPSLVELPTCPVCLERMDDTTGLLTILCQHVFHCACLTKWRGSGCPVCRHTQPPPSINQPFGVSVSDLCRVCDCTDDLWICLICGNVGCGRYKGGHAKDHWKETAHNYALEIETQHVWDYAGDLWVHRLIQTKGDGKLVELPSNARPSHGFGHAREDEDMEMVPRVKLDNICMEYTHLLASQLESQRVYYEEIVKKAVSKASAASESAEAAAAKAEEAMTALRQLSIEHTTLRDEVVPSLEKERDRMALKAEKFGELARTMTKNWQEEKKVGEGLVERIKHVNEGIAGLSRELAKAKEECADLREQNRDLGFFISGREKLTEMQKDGELGDEVVEGVVSLPERREGKGKGKGKGRGK